MPRSRGATLAPPVPNVLAADALDLSGGLSYSDVLAQAGAYRDPRRGVVHRMPSGPSFQRGGRWMQQTKVYPVAMSAEEARVKTKTTGDRHDYYEPGAPCDRCLKAGGVGVVTGWVLGGRKFAEEHEHVTNLDPNLYEIVEVEPPIVDEADEPESALVEA